MYARKRYSIYDLSADRHSAILIMNKKKKDSRFSRIYYNGEAHLGTPNEIGETGPWLPAV